MLSEISPKAPLLRVVDWNSHYENNRTRALKRMEWVPVPNGHDGDGYTELVEDSDGAAHLGCWLAILQVASKCNPRGVLMREGGTPHIAASLARITRLSAVAFDAAIPRLIAIGWLETLPESGMTLPESGMTLRQTDYGMEGNGMEGNGIEKTHASPGDARVGVLSSHENSLPGTTAARTAEVKVNRAEPGAQQEWFDAFWKEYVWRRDGREAARRAFCKHVVSENLFQRVMTALQAQRSGQMAKDPQYRPMASSWLNGARWADEPAQAAVPQQSFGRTIRNDPPRAPTKYYVPDWDCSPPRPVEDQRGFDDLVVAALKEKAEEQ